MKWTALFLFSLIAFQVQAISNKQQNGVIRYAVIAGVNNGGNDRIQLRYATTDAESIASVFTSLGGVSHNNQTLLLEPNSNEILDAIESVKLEVEKQKSLQATGTHKNRIEFIFYYSGHSNEKNLLIGEETLAYKELRQAINSVAADVHVAILDSCASGAFTRLKGGQHVKPFLANNPSNVNGYAYLASSSADEAAQESDAIGGAYFTHYLVSALRGAGDLSQDRRITLNEAYHFAFNETLARTEGSQHGAQHPAYDIQLSGEGDLILTDLTDTSGELILDDQLVGRIYIRNASGRLVVELNKQDLKAVKIGLEPGIYSVTQDKDGEIFKVESFTVNRGTAILAQTDLKKVKASSAIARGSIDSPDATIEIGFKASLFPKVSTHELEPGTRHKVKIDLNAFGHETYEVSGIAAGALITNVESDVKGLLISSAANFTGGDFTGASFSGVNFVKGDATGFMSASIVNITQGHTKGAQFAGVNIANTMSGVQVGFVNYANELNGHAFGFYNHIKDGRRSFAAWIDELEMGHVGVKSGSKYSHSIIAFGGLEDSENDDLFSFTLGQGIRHLDRSWLYLESDLLISTYFTEDSICDECDDDDIDLSLIGKYRLSIGFKLHKHFNLFAGITGNRLFDNDEFGIPNFRDNYLNDVLDNESDRNWQGYVFGFEVL